MNTFFQLVSISGAGENASQEEQTAADEQEQEAESSPAPEVLPQSPKAAEPQQPEPPTSSDASDIDRVTAQLQSALDEIATLKLSLSERDAEITSLKASSAAPSVTAHSEDLQRLTDRLAVLKKEQAEADAAREVAWRQLKSVVGEITKLATAPESASNPTTPGANGLTMGRAVAASS